MAKPTKKSVQNLVNKIYRRIGANVQVPIMKLGEILRAGESILFAGGDEAAAEKAMAEALAEVRAN